MAIEDHLKFTIKKQETRTIFSLHNESKSVAYVQKQLEQSKSPIN